MANATSSQPATPTVWRWEDSRGVGPAIDAALSRAMNLAWRSDAASIADYRAMLFASLYMVDELSTLPTPPVGSDGALKVTERGQSQFASADRLNAATTLLQTYAVMAANASKGQPPVTIPAGFVTTDGGDPVPFTPAPTQGWPLAVFGVAAVVSAAWAYNAYEARRTVGLEVTESITRSLQNTTRMLASHAAALKALDVQRETERTSNGGKPLPLTPGVAATLDALKGDQVRAYGGDLPPPSSRQPTQPAGVGDQVAKIAASAGGLIVLGVVAYAAIKLLGK